jgi:hypothetical protein
VGSPKLKRDYELNGKNAVQTGASKIAVWKVKKMHPIQAALCIKAGPAGLKVETAARNPIEPSPTIASINLIVSRSISSVKKIISRIKYSCKSDP